MVETILQLLLASDKYDPSTNNIDIFGRISIRGNIQLLQIIEQDPRADVTSYDNAGIYHAAIEQRLEMVRFYLDHGAEFVTTNLNDLYPYIKHYLQRSDPVIQNVWDTMLSTDTLTPELILNNPDNAEKSNIAYYLYNKNLFITDDNENYYQNNKININNYIV